MSSLSTWNWLHAYIQRVSTTPSRQMKFMARESLVETCSIILRFAIIYKDIYYQRPSSNTTQLISIWLLNKKKKIPYFDNRVSTVGTVLSLLFG